MTMEPNNGGMRSPPVDPWEEIARLKKLIGTLRTCLKETRDRLKHVREKEIAGLKKTVEVLRSCLKESRGHVEKLRHLRTQFPDVITGCLLENQDWTAAFVANTRLLIKWNRKVEARTFAGAVLANPSTVDAGHLCLALVAHSDGIYGLMRDALAKVPETVVLTYIPAEYLGMLFKIKPAQAERIVRAEIHEGSKIVPGNWLKIAQFAVAAKKTSLARKILRRLNGSLWREQLSVEQVKELDWMRPFLLTGRNDSKSRASSPGAKPVSLGVLDCRCVDYVRTSSNIGDWIQTVAFLSNLGRFQSARFSGDDGLVRFMEKIQSQVFSDRVIAGSPVNVELVAVNRDSSHWSDAPDGTWLVAFGWYMHSMFDLAYNFPFKSSFRPIFISFHVNKPELLTDVALDYFRAHGPIGCRDWNTVDLLLSHGVDAFFSGCVTLTIDNILRKPRQTPVEEEKKEVAFVNSAPLTPEEKKQPHARLSVSQPEIKERTFEGNLEAALARLKEYARYDLLVTSKLHCYLPTTVMGLAVDFRPVIAGDIRFEGLTGLTPETIGSLRDPILLKLQLILEKILSGTDEKEVYAHWREMCAPDVERARSYGKIPPAPPASTEINVTAAQVLSLSKIIGPTAPDESCIEVVFSMDANLKERLPVVLESCVAHASRPLRAWILSRGLSQEDFARYEALFPEFRFCFLPCDRIDYGEIPGLLVHTTVATMDRLFLPVLIPSKKVIYLDVDVLVLDDLAKLFDLPLGDNPLAGKISAKGNSSGYAMIYATANRLEAARSIELRRRMHARHDLRFQPINAGVLLMDLEKMREDRFCEEYLPFVKQYGMNDEEILNCYAGDRRVELDKAWNCRPNQDMIDHARIIHWAGTVKPWNCRWVAGRNQWDYYKSSLQSRMTKKP